jgi:hypothetical protein
MAEMLTYEPSLCSMTGGRGAYSMEFSHYEEVPTFLAEKIIKEAKAEKERAEKHSWSRRGDGLVPPDPGGARAVGAFCAGLLGVGGAIVMIPLLLYVEPALGVGALDVKTVAAVTMVQVFVAALAGVLVHRRYRAVNAELAWTGGLAMAAASFAGAAASRVAPERRCSSSSRSWSPPRRRCSSRRPRSSPRRRARRVRRG